MSDTDLTGMRFPCIAPPSPSASTARRLSRPGVRSPIRATVRCGLYGLDSRGKPSLPRAASISSCKRSNLLTQPSIPTQRILGRLALGNTPAAPVRISKPSWRAAAPLTAGATSTSRDSSMSPRNFSVRCIPSGRTGRSPSMPASRRRRVTWLRARVTSSGKSMAMNALTVRSVSTRSPSPTRSCPC